MRVKDIGPLDASIMVCGEAPGREEAREGVPFVGASGKLLKQMLRHGGIDWRKCYITNVINERPPKNDFTTLYEDKGRKTPTVKLELYWKQLRDKVEWLKPKVIVPVGGEALRAFTGRRGIEAWRGCPIMYKGIPIIATYHPAAILRAYSHHPIAELDFQKAKRWSEGLPEAKKWQIITAPTLHQVLGWLKGCKDKTVSFDLESVGDTVRCLGFARDNTSICIPFMKFATYNPTKLGEKSLVYVGEGSPSLSSYWSVSDEHLIIKALAEFFKDPTIEKVGQNSVGFDQPFLEREFNFEFVNHAFDCMHGFHLLYPELPKGLSFLCSVLTDYPNYWTGKNTQDDVEEWVYNCWDTIITIEVYKSIIKDLEDSKLLNFYQTRLHPLAVALARAQERGVLVDKKLRQGKLDGFEKEMKVNESITREIAGIPTLNLNSPIQLKKLLYEQKGFRRVVDKFGKVGTGAECLKKLQKIYPKEEIFKSILEFRKADKMIDFLASTTKANGRMCTSFNASGTETGRISSSKTIWGSGMNLQNIPRNLRDIFIAPEGHSLVKGDLSQAETRVVAELLKRHGDWQLWERYQNPTFDIHKWMASIIYNKPEKDITKYEREIGKLANHSGNYRAGPKVLETKATKEGIPGVTYDVAREVLHIRNKALPGLEKWWAWIEEELAKCRCLWTCLGRRRMFFGRLDHATFRDATAYEPQSTVGDTNNIIFTTLDRELDERCWPVLQVHDEVVIDCPDEEIKHVIKMMQLAANIPLCINEDEPLVIPIDISVGKDWKNCKEI